MISFDFQSSRILVGQAQTLTLTTYDDGDKSDIGTVTIGITDADGDEVVASGTAVDSDGADGTYTYDLDAQTDPNLLIVTWTESGGTALTGYVEVVGSQLFHEHQIRNFDDKAVSDTDDYPDDDIRQERNRVTDGLEHATGRSWVRRYARAEFSGDSSRHLHLADGIPRTSTGFPLHRPGASHDLIRVLSATDGGVAVSTSNLKTSPDGRITRTDQGWTKATDDDPYNVVIEYEYGLPYPIDGVDRIAMLIAKHNLVSSRIPDHATSMTDPLGTFSFGDASRLPYEAFKWIQAHDTRVPFG